MRSLLTTALLAGVLGPLATTAFPADLAYPDAPPPPPVYEPHPVPPAYVPGPVAPVYVVPRRVVVRPIRVYPRPYYDGQRPVVRAYGEPPYVEDFDRPVPPRAARPYPGPGYERGAPREAEGFRHEREGYDRNVAHETYRHDEERMHYGHYLSRDELERRAERRHDDARDDRYDRARGNERDDHYADRGPGRDFDR